MNTTARLLAVVLAALPGALPAQVLVAPAAAPQAGPRTPEGVIERWPDVSRRMARAMIGKYGPPTRFGEHALYWYDNGQWKRTVVHRDPATRSLFGRGGDILEQSVAYQASRDSLGELKRFDPSLSLDEKTDELISRSDSEMRNILTLNLAVEILAHQRTVADARAFQRRTARLAEAGKSSSYLDGLKFEVQRDDVNHWNP